MGSGPDERGHQTNEGDATGGPHPVVIGRAFCLKATEVTQAEWRDLMGTAPFQHAGCDDCPAECINWWEAAAFCNALSAREGLEPCYALDGWDGTGCAGVAPGAGTMCNLRSGMQCDGVAAAGVACNGYRLPSEAEWEYATRAGTTTPNYGAGGSLADGYLECREPNPAVDAIGWFCGNSGMVSHPAGPADPSPRQPNALGLHDLMGNVLEWTADAYHGSYAGAPADGSTWEAAFGPAPSRVVRGGSWLSDAWYLRSAFRTQDPPGWRTGDLGFRPCRTADAQRP
jgi:formylglycine-generating enzyme required for sulfatase activity